MIFKKKQSFKVHTYRRINQPIQRYYIFINKIINNKHEQKSKIFYWKKIIKLFLAINIPTNVCKNNYI